MDNGYNRDSMGYEFEISLEMLLYIYIYIQISHDLQEIMILSTNGVIMGITINLSMYNVGLQFVS